MWHPLVTMFVGLSRYVCREKCWNMCAATLTLRRVWLQVAVKIKLMLSPQPTYCSEEVANFNVMMTMVWWCGGDDDDDDDDDDDHDHDHDHDHDDCKCGATSGLGRTCVVQIMLCAFFLNGTMQWLVGWWGDVKSPSACTAAYKHMIGGSCQQTVLTKSLESSGLSGRNHSFDTFLSFCTGKDLYTGKDQPVVNSCGHWHAHFSHMYGAGSFVSPPKEMIL